MCVSVCARVRACIHMCMCVNVCSVGCTRTHEIHKHQMIRANSSQNKSIFGDVISFFLWFAADHEEGSWLNSADSQLKKKKKKKDCDTII